MSAVHRSDRFGGRHMVSLNRKPDGKVQGQAGGWNLEASQSPVSSWRKLTRCHRAVAVVCAGIAERNIESLQLSVRSQHRRKHCCRVLMFSQVTIVSVGTVVIL